MRNKYPTIFDVREYGEQVNKITIDERHMVLVFVDATGTVTFIPMYKRRWVYKPYADRGNIVTYSSCPDGSVNAQVKAVKHIQRSTKGVRNGNTGK